MAKGICYNCCEQGAEHEVWVNNTREDFCEVCFQCSKIDEHNEAVKNSEDILIAQSLDSAYTPVYTPNT